MEQEYRVRNARPEEFQEVGQLLVNTYSQIDGFPKKEEQPDYYSLLANIGQFTRRPATELLVAVAPDGRLAGCVVYFSDMQYYGSGGTATQEKNASGFRLLAVDPDFRNKGIGKLLSIACIQKARKDRNEKLVIHSTKSMKVAWKMYEKLGFERAPELDFQQQDLPVFGFRYIL